MLAVAQSESYNLLRDRHRIVLRMLLEGRNGREIQDATGYSQPHISQIKRRPDVQEKLQELQTSADGEALDQVARMQALVPKTMEFFHEIMGKNREDVATPMDHLKLKVGESILDRAGPPKRKQSDVNVENHTLVTSVDVATAKDLAMQAARDAGLLVDVTPTTPPDDTTREHDGG